MVLFHLDPVATRQRSVLKRGGRVSARDHFEFGDIASFQGDTRKQSLLARLLFTQVRLYHITHAVSHMTSCGGGGRKRLN